MNKQTEKELQCKIIMMPVKGARVFDNTGQQKVLETLKWKP